MPGYNRLRLPASYQALTELDTRGLAWEWLRRNPAFRDIWHSANVAARRAAANSDAVVRRSARTLVSISQNPLARRWSHWGLTFRAGSRHAGHASAGDRVEPGT